MKIKKVRTEGNIDHYTVAFDSFDDHPVIELSDVVTLYRGVILGKMINAMDTLSIIDQEDMEIATVKAVGTGKWVKLIKVLNRTQYYLRVKNDNPRDRNK